MSTKSLTPYEASLLAGLALADLKGMSAAGLKKLLASQAGSDAKAIAEALTSNESSSAPRKRRASSRANKSANAIKRWARAQRVRR